MWTYSVAPFRTGIIEFVDDTHTLLKCVSERQGGVRQLCLPCLETHVYPPQACDQIPPEISIFPLRCLNKA